ncbi:tRNA pseudouridine(38-40) synthase TruA [Roseburia sp. OM04-10BH]|nr:tRNA pseudouridine(38-40) synthase TruA [Roseburia sp. OM04-10BH]RGI45667.1 tRNA pseudouridine(38-40) synthase TruA [Roseburia sp. OM04-10BH]RHV41122.1 tRNA pseudouridine(38-40) synthase TruA [Roseburia sp. OM04-15AA]RHV59208.1 tRNA pseudouridine(38-40) synthase TruA [Roseburia sp. OM04-10AA]
MINYKMILQYDGSRYSGWQVQGNTEQTIQGKLQSVLEKMTGEEIEIHGSGRTDAGVHAMGQVANFKLQSAYEPEEIKRYCNQYLPEDIVVLEVSEVPLRFHSRLNAIKKTYCYRIFLGEKPDVFRRKYVTPVAENLDINKMKAAAEVLLGTHDFTSFCGNRHFKKSAVRTIYEIRLEEKTDELDIYFTGNGFLQNMVRILTGTLLEVGTGKQEVCEMKEILEGRNRSLAGTMAAAKGLVLVNVEYE